MGDDQRKPGSDLFIVDNSDADWKVRNYLTEWCGLAKTIDIAAGDRTARPLEIRGYPCRD